ncbi:MAG: FMN-binding protein [Anaerovoracaceae bacterium]
MKGNGFWIKVIDIILIVGAILFYNQAVYYRNNAKEANKQLKAYADQIEKMQERNKASSAGKKQASAAKKYKDGKYTGSARGYGGQIVVSVNVKQDVITDIQVVSASGETDTYYNSAVSVIDSILDAQSTDVDSVSGATYSSNGIKNAVKAALAKAKK